MSDVIGGMVTRRATYFMHRCLSCPDVFGSVLLFSPDANRHMCPVPVDEPFGSDEFDYSTGYGF